MWTLWRSASSWNDPWCEPTAGAHCRLTWGSGSWWNCHSTTGGPHGLKNTRVHHTPYALHQTGVLLYRACDGAHPPQDKTSSFPFPPLCCHTSLHNQLWLHSGSQDKGTRTKKEDEKNRRWRQQRTALNSSWGKNMFGWLEKNQQTVWHLGSKHC